MREKIIAGALWLVMILVMAASVSHLAATFGTLEVMGLEIVGWLPAVAVDAGLLAITYAVHTKRQKAENTRFMQTGLAIFVILSVFANVDHATTVVAERYNVTEGWFSLQRGWEWQAIKVFALSGMLPLLIWFVAEVLGVLFGKKKEPATALATTASHELTGVVENHAQNEPLVVVEDPPPLPDKPAPPALPEPITEPHHIAPPAHLPKELQEAVLLYVAHGSFGNAAKFTKVSRETLRKRVTEAQQLAPNWVAIVTKERQK